MATLQTACFLALTNDTVPTGRVLLPPLLAVARPPSDFPLPSHSRIIAHNHYTCILTCRMQSTPRIQPIISHKRKRFKVYSFKGNILNNEDGVGPTGSQLSQKPLQLSFKEMEREETIAESSDLMDQKVASTVDDQLSIAGSPAIKRMLRKWLSLLQAPKPIPAKGEPGEDNNQQNGPVEVHHLEKSPHTESLVKAMFPRFGALDITFKLSLLIIPTSYLFILLHHGMEVAQELTPLFLLGPLIIALYVKMIRAVFAFHVHCLKLLQNFTVILLRATKYTIRGQLIADVSQSVKRVMSVDYKGIISQKIQEKKELYTKRKTDYIESVWPQYYKLIMYLKNARFI